jgi:FMN reductase
MEGMRVAVRQCYGWSLPYGLAIDGKHDLDEEGRLKSPALQSRLRMMARDTVIYGTMLYTQFLEDVARNVPESFAARYG